MRIGDRMVYSDRRLQTGLALAVFRQRNPIVRTAMNRVITKDSAKTGHRISIL